MKKIILPFVLLFSIYGFSQSKIEITKEGLTNTTQVIELDNLSAKEIYSRINKYIQKNYTNPDKVSKGNIENEFVSFNGITKSPYFTKSFGQEITSYVDLEYYFNIDIKDGKIKLSISKLTETIPKPSGFPDSKINLLTANMGGYFNKDGSINDKFLKYKNTKEKTINDIIIDFVSSIKETKKSDW